ncbi:unnamed protein product [Adineta steineri]|uniref:Uncharacterized protein n=1 Tax=Adineta steineri TaxID=433720 RepID=A0A815FMN8_9BILA|nr:unnamed protein product [Adineta steineri]CAF1588291.1 unnamed protein product [Adineta steineri]
MFMVFLLIIYINTIDCQTITTTAPTFIYGCSFTNNTYLTNAAVSNQFQFLNSTSIKLTASYAFLSTPLSISTFGIGLIYPFSTSVNLVPFPVFLNCASSIQSCQLGTIAVTTTTTRASEPIGVQLSPFNYSSSSSSSILFNQMGLYLNQGSYQLSNCTLNNGQYMTDPQTIFNIQIQYEKTVGTSCNPSTDTCGISSLTTCSSSSLTCTCLSPNSLVSYSNSFYCADTLNSSNCNIFPSRCVTWCNATTNSLCICPSDTLKIQRNYTYVCELPVNSLNCSSNDSIRRCSLGQSCINGQCIDSIITTTKINDTSSPLDQRLRIALGVIAGLLGTSILVLLGAFCWIRQRHKRQRAIAEKSLSLSSVPSATPTSSLYMSPTEHHEQQQQQRQPSLPNRVYQLPVENNNSILLPIYRTNSFRQAINSGYNQTTEHVSTKRDSFIDRSIYEKDDLDSSNYSTLQYVIPTRTLNYQYSNEQNNIYQVFMPSSSPTSLTHDV